MDAWNTLTAALDELDAVRAHVARGRAQQRATTFFELVQPDKVSHLNDEGEDVDAGHLADVIQLDDGFCLVHWLHDPTSTGIYSSILTLRRALCATGALLVVTDISPRRGRDPRPETAPMLTDGERDMLLLVGHGLSNQEIAQQLVLSESHVKNTLSQAYKKLKVQDRTQAALLVRDLGLAASPDDSDDPEVAPPDDQSRPPHHWSSRLPSRPADTAAAWRNEYYQPRDQ